MRLLSRPHLLLSLVVPLAAACAPPPHEHEPDGPEPVGEAVLAATVAEAATNGCSTSSVKGLSLQIIAQGACIAPGSFVEVPAGGGLTFTEPVLPYIQQPAKDALLAALADKPGTAMQVNSMLRTVAQQYLLYTWYQQGKCGIGLAATPGNSNHETGLALDIQQYDAWKSTLTAHGFAWYGNDDPVHFDYVGPGAVNYKGTDVRAFQMLWNKNHPGDPIAEDGLYGPQTEARLKQSPAEGFAIGADCNPNSNLPDIHPSLAFVGAADDLPDGASAGRTDLYVGDLHAVEIHVQNKGIVSAQNVDIVAEAAAPHLTLLDYLIETDHGHPGSFEENDANTDPANPPHGSDLGPSLGLKLNAFAKGETKRVTLTLRADAYSIQPGAAPDIRFWVRDVPGAYHQETFGGAADNIEGSQTWGGGKLEVSAPADVYSRTQWLWDTDRREGWDPIGPIPIATHPKEGFLSVASSAAGPWAQSQLLSLSAEALPFVEVSGRLPSGGEAFLYFATSASPELDETRRIPIGLPTGAAFGEAILEVSTHPAWTGTLTRLALGGTAGGALDIDSLRLVPEPGGGEGGEGGAGGAGGSGGGGSGAAGEATCTCALPGSTTSPLPGRTALLTALLGIAAVLRRRGRAGGVVG